jgi:hypothetical protein
LLRIHKHVDLVFLHHLEKDHAEDCLHFEIADTLRARARIGFAHRVLGAGALGVGFEPRIGKPTVRVLDSGVATIARYLLM